MGVCVLGEGGAGMGTWCPLGPSGGGGGGVMLHTPGRGGCGW